MKHDERLVEAMIRAAEPYLIDCTAADSRLTEAMRAALVTVEARIAELETHCGRLESAQQLDEMNDTIQSLHAQLQGAKNRIAELETAAARASGA